MKSYIKIYGPPLIKAIRALEKISVNMADVCIMNTKIEQELSGYTDPRLRAHDTDFAMDYFGQVPIEITTQRCDTIISKSGESVGEYDFYFEWLKEPSMPQLNDLIGKIDEALTPLGCKYTITTKN